MIHTHRRQFEKNKTISYSAYRIIYFIDFMQKRRQKIFYVCKIIFNFTKLIIKVYNHIFC